MAQKQRHQNSATKLRFVIFPVAIVPPSVKASLLITWCPYFHHLCGRSPSASPMFLSSFQRSPFSPPILFRRDWTWILFCLPAWGLGNVELKSWKLERTWEVSEHNSHPMRKVSFLNTRDDGGLIILSSCKQNYWMVSSYVRISSVIF